jgi:ADP-heptose:LPS heptosyltransferase
LKSTSCELAAQEVLDRCLAGDPPETLPPALIEEPCGKALFGILVEGLADRFEPSLCDIYARLFSPVVGGSVARYCRVRRPRPVLGEPRRVLVLSRDTLGADVAVTSVLLAAAKERFPKSEIVFAGPTKNFELFAADSRLTHLPIAYRRGSLRDRLAAGEDLKALAADPDCLIIDPDSRLTQLGLLPIGEEDRYHLFESRGYGGDSDRALPELAADWAAETFGVQGAKPYIAIPRGEARYITINLGVGENPAKRIPDPFEEQLIALLAATGEPIIIDKGAGGEEGARVERAAEHAGERAGAKPQFWEGSFAGFAKLIAASRLYVGYDSAGQHVAAALGVPLIGIFAGFPAPRMFERWKPIGEHSTVIRVERADAAETLDRVRAALQQVRWSSR